MPPSRYLTIHGHFYQPPRENPWLEAVETQDSAAPFHDWNERITAECYEPNAYARVLDDQDRIVRIVNNYASISFNFGPTLLSWLESGNRETYHAIIEADRVSRERFGGHGSAIAQAYNHVILPLANPRDQKTQVRWGIRDFERRFGRRPEGMWLPETAVDLSSLEALAAEGIAFTILEPHQAARFRELGAESWTAASGQLDPTTPYLCRLPSGASITLFFYDGPISRGVAFEHLLDRGEYFALRLVGAFNGSRAHPQLVNVATDGETYGHHHRYGDMALAYAIQYIDDHELAALTNYGQFLALHPPTREVEIQERTSWSCAHGVERWRSDCGCNSDAPAGWNQRWRGPLRQALDWLRDEVGTLFEERGTLLLGDPWAARNDYIDVVLDRSDPSMQRFLEKYQVAGSDVVTVLELLELQRNALLMFTSCGWFFNDISGIETVQILQYAGRVIQLGEKLSGRPLEEGFTSLLAQAQSNLPERGIGRDIYQRQVAPTRLELGRVAAHYAVAALFDSFDDDVTVYCYRVVRHDFDLYRAGRARMAVASITVTSLITREEASFELAVLHLGETELTGGLRVAGTPAGYERDKELLGKAFQPGGIPATIRLLDQHFNETPISIRALFRDEQRRILNLICNATLEEAESAFRQLHERYDPLMRFHARLGIPLPKVLQMAAEFDVNVQLRRLLEQSAPPLAEIEARLREARDERVPLDDGTVLAIQRSVERAAAAFVEHPEERERLEAFEAIISLIDAMAIEVDLRKPQNQYYRMKIAVRPAIAASASNGASAQWLQLFDTLGEKLHISPTAGEE
jgi:alpha-amylase/alpha-mannosidase (GH57 family)